MTQLSMHLIKIIVGSESEVDVNTLLVATSSDERRRLHFTDLYATLALGASFLCSVLEAVLLSTSISHVKVPKKGSWLPPGLDSRTNQSAL